MMDPDRRVLLKSVSGILALAGSSLVAAGSYAASRPRDMPEFNLGLEREIQSILDQARQLDLAGPRSAVVSPKTMPELSLKLVEVLDRALEKGKAGDEDASALADRVGMVLSQIVRANRDLVGLAVGPRAARRWTFEQVRGEYKQLFRSCKVAEKHKRELLAAAKRIVSTEYKRRYKEAEADTQVPWFVIGALHYREASLNFMGHLHNGNFLRQKTVDVPAQRPAGKWPPEPWNAEQAWRVSAKDALLRYQQPDWSLERMLFTFESYNGWGYRNHPGFRTPYLWNYTQHYQSGGFPSDHVWSNSYVSKQAGVVAILKTLTEISPGEVTIPFTT